MSLSPRPIRQRVLQNRKILARLEGRTNPNPSISEDAAPTPRQRSAPTMRLYVPHACGFAAALPKGVYFAPRDSDASSRRVAPAIRVSTANASRHATPTLAATFLVVVPKEAAALR